MAEFLGIDKTEWEYLRFIVFQNFVVLIFILLFIWDGWDIEVFQYISFGSLLEFLLLVFSVPFYLAFAWKLFEVFKSKRSQTVAFYYALTMSVLLIGGTGIHFAANQIRAGIDTPMIEFYDEVLSHYMIWIGILGLNVFFGLFQDEIPLKKRMGNSELAVLTFSGLLQGGVVTLLILESRFGLVGFISGILFLTALLIDMRGKSYRKHPVFVFYIVVLTAIILGLTTWFIGYGGFPEPSTTGFGRF